MNNLMIALKEILKHRRIKSRSELNLFSVIIDDLFKHLSSRYSNLTYIKDKIDLPPLTILQQELEDTQVFIKKWLNMFISSDVIEKLDLTELSKFSLDVSYDIISNIINGFYITHAITNSNLDNDNKLITFSIHNSKIPNKTNIIQLHNVDIKTQKNIIDMINKDILDFFININKTFIK